MKKWTRYVLIVKVNYIAVEKRVFKKYIIFHYFLSNCIFKYFPRQKTLCLPSEIMEISSLKRNLSLNAPPSRVIARHLFFNKRCDILHLSTVRTNAIRTLVTTLKLFRLGNFLTNKLAFVILRILRKTNKLKRKK